MTMNSDTFYLPDDYYDPPEYDIPDDYNDTGLDAEYEAESDSSDGFGNVSGRYDSYQVESDINGDTLAEQSEHFIPEDQEIEPPF